MRLSLLIVLALALLTSSVFGDYLDDPKLQGILRSVSDPKLKYPLNEIVDLTDKDSLEFRWGLYDTRLVARNYIELKVYKSNTTDDDKLIFRKRLSAYTYSFKINTAFFDGGQIYTWEIRQIFLRGKAASSSSSNFKVIKDNFPPKR